MNPLVQLLEHGQSYWLDNLTRHMLHDGELQRRVNDEGLRGMTSNPAIFSKAISNSKDYDEQIERLVEEGRATEQIYEALVISDIQAACDILRPVYDASDGLDGYVSLEVSPHLAHDTQGSIEDGRRLHTDVDRPNLLIKIPGTPEGVPAIEELLFEGVCVNVTLLFSIESYEAVAWAYVRALERRVELNLPIRYVSSVASFFLSRIDSLVDKHLDKRLRTGTGGSVDPKALLGKAAIANAKLAYAKFQEILASERWQALAGKGAQPQRMLWASTSTKNPEYRDVRYIEPLIGPYTINTLPEETIAAFADHGVVQDTVDKGGAEARKVMDDLARLGIEFAAVTEQLLDEGVQKFIEPYDELLATIENRSEPMSGAHSLPAEGGRKTAAGK